MSCEWSGYKRSNSHKKFSALFPIFPSLRPQLRASHAMYTNIEATGNLVFVFILFRLVQHAREGSLRLDYFQ